MPYIGRMSDVRLETPEVLEDTEPRVAIDVTEQMIRAGAEALIDWQDGVDWYGLGAIKIFSAMLAACESAELGEDGRKLLPHMTQFS